MGNSNARFSLIEDKIVLRTESLVQDILSTGEKYKQKLEEFKETFKKYEKKKPSCFNFFVFKDR